MAENKSCFIIMPITTPENAIDSYRDGEDHFEHVLDCLIVPSIEEANFDPISPIGKGSDMIPAEIIKNLEAADLVLCDMSCLNPNVFFEFGIRTSLNKPVCVIKDELTEKVPFDTAMINYQEYQSSLEPWDLKAAVQKLAKHITDSYTRSEEENTLWKYFGIKFAAAPYEGGHGADDKLDYLVMQADSTARRLNDLEERALLSAPHRKRRPIPFVQDMWEKVSEVLPDGIEVLGIEQVPKEPREFLVLLSGGSMHGFSSAKVRQYMKHRFGPGIHFRFLQEQARPLPLFDDMPPGPLEDEG